MDNALEIVGTVYQEEKCTKLSGTGPLKIVIQSRQGFNDTPEDKALFQQRAEQLKNLNTEPLEPSNYTMYMSNTIGQNSCGSAPLRVVLEKRDDGRCGFTTGLFSGVVTLLNLAFDASCGSPALTLAHEAGHAVGGLYDEYIFEERGIHPDNAQKMYELYGPRNCIRTSSKTDACQYFSQFSSNQCFQGCMSTDIWRDAPDDIMTDEGNYFGPVDKYLLNEAINKYR